MPTVPLPSNPNLEHLRRQARDLQRAVRRGEPDALALVDEFGPPARERFALSTAQLVLARRYGFASWPRLRRHVEVVTARSWSPGPSPDGESLPDRFLRLACLTYDDEAPANRAAAARLLADHPDLPHENVFVAAACADVSEVERRLASDDRRCATATGGPFGWSPLLYQAYARHDPDVGEAATVSTAAALLAAGADPNDGRFWRGLPTPFTVLTGVFGGGERDERRHPQSISFARVLLEAGGDPNDGQTLYNRMFSTDDVHLELLFDFGLGKGDGGPWRRLLGDAIDTPAEMLRSLLWWAVTHDQRERVELLAAHGVDVRAAFATTRGGHTPAETALLNGHRELAERLTVLGGERPVLDPVERFVAAALGGDGDAVRSAEPATVAAARRRRPGLLAWAAATGAPESVPLLVAAGFDVDARGRSDAPIDQAWETALHVAAQRGDVELARRLLALGADPSVRDARFDGTPLDWARHFDQAEVVAALEPTTDPTH